MDNSNDDQMARAENVLKTVRDEWLRRPGVTAVDLGFKWTKGEITDQVAIRVHVSKKRPLPEIAAAEKFPDEIDGISVDVLEAIYGLQQADGQQTIVDSQTEMGENGRLQQRLDPVPIGASIGSANVTAGTLGAKLFDAASGAEMILSNWHVFAGSTSAAAGLSIRQPGPIDGGRTDNDTIAKLSRFVLGPYDAAVATITGTRPVKDETIDGTPIRDATPPRLGMRVWKSGRTTGRTEGFIDGMYMTMVMNYGAAGARRMQEVLRIIPIPGTPPSEISSGGDSGSVWVDQASGKAVGLHFGGELGDAPEHALANDIMGVLDRLQVLFLDQQQPEEPVPPPPPPIEPNPPTPIISPPLPNPMPLPNPPKTKKLSFWQRLAQWFTNLFS